MTVGIPRGLFYYYYGDMWRFFFDKLGIDYIISPLTDSLIKSLGSKFSTDEMCLSLKIYIGHVAYLSDKCDVVLVPRIDNYGKFSQTCTNFLACYDIINNLFDVDVIDYNVCYTSGDTLKKAFFSLGEKLGKKRSVVKNAYYYSLYKFKKILKGRIIQNMNKLSMDGKKILFVSHPYNSYDSCIGLPVINYLEKNGCIVIYSDLFDDCSSSSFKLSPGLYWKYSQDIIGSIELCKDRVDGIIFLSSFPCGLDSLVNEVVIRKLDKRCLNLVIDDMDAFAGIETRLESFIDIV
jgi:predicted nucleotide-binding protein (sugar kinase/HSP70/actin superfamily)